MAIDDDFYDKLETTIRNWDEAHNPKPPPPEMEGLDFTQSETPPAMDAAVPATPPAPAAEPPLRLRAPEPELDLPATAGAGQKGGPSTFLAAEPAVSRPPLMPMSAPASGEPDWKSIGDRLGIGQLAQNSSRAYTNMFANIVPGYRPNPHAGDIGVDMVKGELDVDKAKQGHEQHELAMSSQKAAAGVKAAMSDPNSLQSQKARESIKAIFGDVVPLPAGFDRYSANDIQEFASSGKLAQAASIRNAAEDDKRKIADDELKRKEAGTKEGRTAAETDALRREVQKIDPKMDLTGLSSTDLRALRDADNAKTRAYIMAAAQKEKDKDKKTDGLPYGMELLPDANPSADQIKALGLADQGARDLHKLAEEMRPLLAKSSKAGRFFGDTKRELQRIAAEMTIAAKNAGGLGQITAGDEALINAIRPNAVNWDSLLRDYDSFDTQLRGLEKWGNNKVEAGMEGMGVRRKGSHADPGTPPIPGKGGEPPDTPSVPEERIIDGVKYRKKGDKWVTDA